MPMRVLAVVVVSAVAVLVGRWGAMAAEPAPPSDPCALGAPAVQCAAAVVSSRLIAEMQRSVALEIQVETMRRQVDAQSKDLADLRKKQAADKPSASATKE